MGSFSILTELSPLCFCTFVHVRPQVGRGQRRPGGQRHSERTGGYSAPGNQCPDSCSSPAAAVTHVPAVASVPGLRRGSGLYRNHAAAECESHLMNRILLIMTSVKPLISEDNCCNRWLFLVPDCDFVSLFILFKDYKSHICGWLKTKDNIYVDVDLFVS